MPPWEPADMAVQAVSMAHSIEAVLTWSAALGWCCAHDVDSDVVGIVSIPIQGNTPVSRG